MPCTFSVRTVCLGTALVAVSGCAVPDFIAAKPDPVPVTQPVVAPVAAPVAAPAAAPVAAPQPKLTAAQIQQQAILLRKEEDDEDGGWGG